MKKFFAAIALLSVIIVGSAFTGVPSSNLTASSHVAKRIVDPCIGFFVDNGTIFYFYGNAGVITDIKFYDSSNNFVSVFALYSGTYNAGTHTFSARYTRYIDSPVTRFLGASYEDAF